MDTLNLILLIGRLGTDPEIQSFQNSSFITKLSIATSESWTDKHTGEKKQTTSWHQVIAYNTLAKIAFQDLKKGDLVYLEGSIKYEKFIDNQGIDRCIAKIMAKQIYPLL